MMANKYNDSSSYMDGVPVKISEKYKPPKRIILPTNTQRITSVDILHNPNFKYDFTLEHLIKSKMKELRDARRSVTLERAARIKNYQEKLDSKLKVSEISSTNIKMNFPNTDSVLYPNKLDCSEPNEVQSPPIVGSDITSTVLMPITMTNNSTSSSSYSSCDTPSSTPINISDFENDTASPFDNMELKTLNDLAELAQVLQPMTQNSNYTYNSGSTAPISGATPLANIPPPPTSINDNSRHQHHLNGFYTKKFFPQNYDILYPSYKYNESHPISPPQNTPMDESTSASGGGASIDQRVPNIINALQKELMHTHISEATATMTTEKNEQIVRTLPSTKNKTSGVIQKKLLPNPYSTLPTRMQHICKDVSLMGFPLDRVARACAIIGEDQSRLIEHMIAMSQLLDLGFSEENITKALLRCDNDRDKALDYLVA